MFHFERKGERLAPQHVFLFRVLRNFAAAGVVILLLVAVGTWGFYRFEGHSFLDSLHDAVRTICGLDPTNTPKSIWGKWFEIVFHLLSSLVVVVATSIFLVPIAHRILHRFHVEDDEAD